MRIQILSDLHVEFKNYRIKIADAADVLVMAGDYCVAKNIKNLAWLARSTDKQIVFVTGNHEYYDGIIEEVDKSLTQTSAKHSNFHFLNNSRIQIEDVEFAGCALWSDFDLAPDLLGFERMVSGAINDFRYIKTSPEDLFTPDDCRRLNRQSRRFLRDATQSNFNGKRVIVTHFLPSPKSFSAAYEDSQLNPYFCCNCEPLMGSDVALWVHGHTHLSADYEVAGTRVIANPRGYYGDNREFKGKLLVEI